VLALLAGLVALAFPAMSAAATPCGEKVLADWFDNGRIDRIYPLHCYEEAIDAIPADLRDYADAEDVIGRALQAAINGDLAAGGIDPTPGEDPGGGGPGGGGGGGGGGNGNPPTTNPGTEPEASPEVDTSGLSSLPIPLLVLGGMSVALLAAGGLGYLSRRRAAALADESDVQVDDELI
jgi:hypothetical protein